jgi:hypothetical protein
MKKKVKKLSGSNLLIIIIIIKNESRGIIGV